MAKKHKKKGLKDADPSLREEGGESITSRGWKVVGAGVLILALGFFVLTYTDPLGKNWASKLSPFLILGAYGIIAAGILLPDEPPQTTQEKPAASGPAQ
jgi:hypothetical protein